MPEEKPKCIRNMEGSRIYYDVLSSKKSFYYTVDMLGPLAVSCDCDNHTKGHTHCKHQKDAEVAEQIFQQNSPVVSSVSVNETEKRTTAPLNGLRAFSFLRCSSS